MQDATAPTPTPSDQAYPDAPWILDGRIVLGQVTARRPLTPTSGLRHLLDRRLLLFLGRYRQGTLDYSELVLAAYARRGLRPGLEIRHIWVDNDPALLGGVHIWGLPKKLATFDWSHHHVRVSDDHGPVTTLTWTPGRNVPGRLPVPLWFFGTRDGALLHTTAKARCRLTPARLTVDEWTDRLPALTSHRARLGAVCDPSRAIVPPARVLTHLPAPSTGADHHRQGV
ncbi:acetoacetate decarboxylase family protein [Streptomyces sp. NPDC020883]|uniref:acetoacetate decarboxylase family protein n=1 Tax=Streptomyces sp. NPDC020883 TaxID=3365099 RepID=UPI0037A0E816